MRCNKSKQSYQNIYKGAIYAIEVILWKHFLQRAQSKMAHTCIEQLARQRSDHARTMAAPWKEHFWRKKLYNLRLLWYLNFSENSIQARLYWTLIVNTVRDKFEPCNSTVYIWQTWQYWMYSVFVFSKRDSGTNWLTCFRFQEAVSHLLMYIDGAGKPHGISWLVIACITIFFLQ